jgi:hypothetical protein
MTRLQQLAAALSDGQWHTNTELFEKAGPRFGAAILNLREGKHDGEHWIIEGEAIPGEPGKWRFRHTGFSGRYRPNSPRCPKCNTKMTKDEGSAYSGGNTTEKQLTLLEQAQVELASLRGIIEWQAGIIKKQNYELEVLRKKADGHPHPTSHCGGAL